MRIQKTQRRMKWVSLSAPGLLFITLLVIAFASVPLAAQSDAGQAQSPATVGQATGEVRTGADIAKSAATLVREQGAPPPFLPTMDPSEYEQMKAASAAMAQFSGRRGASSITAPPVPPIATALGFDGDNQSDSCCTPPDVHAASGAGEVTEVTNDNVSVYDNFGNLLSITKLNVLFGTAEFVFDPRVQFDPIWHRWVITATHQAPTSGSPADHFWIAISSTSDANPASGYIVYQVPLFGEGLGNWCDYDQMGMDQDAVQVTCNIFHTGGGFVHGWLTSLAKSRLYNAQGVFVPVFVVGPGVAPAMVSPDTFSGANGNTYFLAANAPGTNILNKYTMTNSAKFFAITLSGPVAVTTPLVYTIPPAASQPGTAAKLDSLDARFVNDITQVGAPPASLFAVHTITDITPTPRWYEINSVTNAVLQSSEFFVSGTSNDFNVSILTNPNKDAFVNWTSTDPPAGTQAEMRIAGRCHGDPLGTMNPPGQSVASSPTFYLFGRWGDYSSLSIDLDDDFTGLTAWAANETIINTSAWNTHLQQIAFPACP